MGLAWSKEQKQMARNLCRLMTKDSQELLLSKEKILLVEETPKDTKQENCEIGCIAKGTA
jgi:hypothetical protein